MLFNDKYPEANAEEEYEYGNYIWTDQTDNCYMCGRLTHFVEINAGAYICSEECDEKFYFEMFSQALNKNNIIDF